MDNLNDILDASLTQSVVLTFVILIISQPPTPFFFAKAGHHQYDVCLFCVIRRKLKFCLEGQY